MQKRFSIREVALLTAPVLVVGAFGWWLSKRPRPAVDDGKLSLSFQVSKPTMLEAFEGFDGAFEVKAEDRTGTQYGFRSAKPYLELQTAQGMEVSRLDRGREGFWVDFWGDNLNNSRFRFKMRYLPPGKLHFGFDGLANPLWTQSPAPPPPVRLQGKWEVDRALIKSPHLAALPHQPWVVLRSVKIVEVKLVKKPREGDPIVVKGEAIFDLQNDVKNVGTSLDSQFSIRRVPTEFPEGNDGFFPRIGWGMGGFAKPSIPATDDTRLLRWEVGMDDDTASGRVQVTGRVSAGERWPLGFELEPFRARDVKVGQKLGFKSFRVALPR